MEKVIRVLKEIREKTEKQFIENCIYVHNARLDSPVPDTKSDLEMIIELNKAITTLEDFNMVNYIPPISKLSS